METMKTAKELYEVTRQNRFDPTGEKTEDLKRATREANETLRDFKATLKEAKSLVGEIHKLIEGQVKDLVETAVADHVASLGDATKKAMDDSVEKVQSEFNKLEDILLGRDGQDDRERLEDLIRKGMCETHGVHRTFCRRMLHDVDSR